MTPVGPNGTFPNIEQYGLPTMCQQCVGAPCVEVCPTGASYRDEETGIVLIDQENCIGCESCLSACPYGARGLNEAEQARCGKCTLGRPLTDKGELPACVKACCGEGSASTAIWMIRKAMCPSSWRRTTRLTAISWPNSGNGPSTIYLLSPKFATWVSDDAVQVSNA